MPGKVTLVGAGPGDPGLLTRKGLEALQNAEVVVYDRLVGPAILALMPEHAEQINVGKQASHHPIPQDQINRILLDKALEGKNVVRLKGGDPFLFGRGGEELELLVQHGVPFEEVPGITSAIAAPAYGGIPVTHRDCCSSLHIVTGHQRAGKELDIDFEALVRTGGTLVFLMGVSALPALCRGLLDAGMAPDTPAATVESGTTPAQRRTSATLADLPRRAAEVGVESPAVIVVGQVCALAEQFDWFDRLPLKGKTVVVTRPKERAGTLSGRLRSLGADVWEYPCIATVPLEPCPTRTCFQRDIDRIVHSKAFRRLKHKTQVFLEPEGDHYRTRMTHTIEVSRIARTIARGLRLNEDLAEAAAYGHDLGHTPFGHAGERVLAEIMPGGFAHNQQSLRVVDRLEKDGEGLNLTYEVRRGILCHTGPDRAETLEGQLLRLADKIAYINHDIDDAIRGKIIYPMDLPLSVSQVLGFTHSERINTLTVDIITQSQGKDQILQSPACRDAMHQLREFMFEYVYRSPVAKGEEGKAQDMLRRLFEAYVRDPDKLPPEYQAIRVEEGVERAVCDYLSGMTDKYAVEQFGELFIPHSWSVK